MTAMALPPLLPLACVLVAFGTYMGPADAAGHRPGTRKEEQELGRALFFDTGLSADGRVSCASCHRPEAAFGDVTAVSTGAFNKQGTRNAPSLLGASAEGELFWDGRRASLEALVLDPLLNTVEHGLPSLEALTSAVRARHMARFAKAFPGDEVRPVRIAEALAVFVRALTRGESPYDLYAAGDTTALSASQRRGLALFSGRAGCARCHRLENGLFTDGAYHAGESLTRSQRADAAATIPALSEQERRDAISLDPGVAALGRYVVTLRPSDIGRFRTPSLRNVAVTAPYMHDGQAASLAEAVQRELYYRRPPGLRLGDLTPSEREDLVAFLKSLTSFPGTRHAANSPPRK